jgi:hypothetical protein
VSAIQAIESPTRMNLSWENSISYAQYLHMEPPLIAPEQVVRAKTINPKVCGCCSQGLTMLDVVHNRNICRGGDIVLVGIHVDNKRCKRKINNVAVRLVKNVFFQYNGGTHRLR